ncbi:MAG TPA: 3'(2'),5'-bisphosphate nucleotidase CysQ [Nitrospira sp.]|nr:3'(2'),5'-bisphosphate nucleotidase CysQ [Nitrospira sp.]
MERELQLLVDSVNEAGRRALELARTGFDVHMKHDRSPVTTADLEVERILHAMQRRHFPDDGWLSEESPDDLSRLNRPRVWIIDPIDGTKAYVNGLPEFCISAALVERGSPVLAAILNPSTDELFTAINGKGLFLNGTPVRPPKPGTFPVVMVNPWEHRRGRWQALHQTVDCRPMYSIANALTLVAAGRVAGAITAEPENEWDLAAAVLLIQEAGGRIEDAVGRSFSFNQPKPRFRGLIALAPGTDDGLYRVLSTQVAEAAGQRLHS